MRAALAVVFYHAIHLPSSLASLIVMTALAAVLVAGLLYGEKGSMARLLLTQPVQTLGRISFSFYLLNVPVLYLIWAFTDRWAWTKTYALETGLVVGVISAAMTWPLAALSETWIERPAIRLGRALSSWVAGLASDRQPAPPATLS